MFDFAPTELLLCAVIALVVIGPKDLPKAMRFVGNWVAKARRTAGHFRVGLDAMMREAELKEMEEKWKAHNDEIMRAYPHIDSVADPMLPAPPVQTVPTNSAPAVPSAAAPSPPSQPIAEP